MLTVTHSDGSGSSISKWAWSGGLSLLGEQGSEEVLALLRPSVRAVLASGIIPEVNPTGLRQAD